MVGKGEGGGRLSGEAAVAGGRRLLRSEGEAEVGEELGHREAEGCQGGRAAAAPPPAGGGGGGGGRAAPPPPGGGGRGRAAAPPRGGGGGAWDAPPRGGGGGGGRFWGSRTARGSPFVWRVLEKGSRRCNLEVRTSETGPAGAA